MSILNFLHLSFHLLFHLNQGFKYTPILVAICVYQILRYSIRCRPYNYYIDANIADICDFSNITDTIYLPILLIFVIFLILPIQYI